ncbi:unnamed protein product, partial [marine sediment metagenome]
KAANDKARAQIEGFKAQTGRMELQVKAAETGVKINTEKIEAFGKQLDNTEKIINITSVGKFAREEIKQSGAISK